MEQYNEIKKTESQYFLIGCSIVRCRCGPIPMVEVRTIPGMETRQEGSGVFVVWNICIVFLIVFLCVRNSWKVEWTRPVWCRNCFMKYLHCFVIALLSAFVILGIETCEKKRWGLLLTSGQKLSPNRLPHPLYNWVSKRYKEIQENSEFIFINRIWIDRMYVWAHISNLCPTKLKEKVALITWGDLRRIEKEAPH